MPLETPWYPGRNSSPAVPDRWARPDDRPHHGACSGPARRQRAHEVSCVPRGRGRPGRRSHRQLPLDRRLLLDARRARPRRHGFFRHRPSGALRAPVYAEDWRSWPFDTVAKLWNEVIHPHTNDASKWELVRSVPMKFNRLVLSSSVAVAQRGRRLRRPPREWAVDLSAVVQLRVMHRSHSRQTKLRASSGSPLPV